jgi:hypothetical protein
MNFLLFMFDFTITTYNRSRKMATAKTKKIPSTQKKNAPLSEGLNM